ncbi:DUF3383 family protein [Paenibacillus sp. strain BS8-2]
MATIGDVTVIIDIQRPTPRIGFGLPLILGTSAAGSAYKKYTSLTAVAADFDATTEEHKAAAALFGQGEDSPAEIAILTRRTGATPETVEEAITRALLHEWYFLIATSTAVADLEELADAIEADDSRFLFIRSSSKVDIAALQENAYERTAVMYHTNTANYPESAWIGRTGTKPVGVTWKFKGLTGISPVALNADELGDIHALNAQTYVSKAGKAQTSEGKSLSGEYIDIIRSKDYVKATIEHDVQTLLNNADKIPYDDSGIAQIEGVVKITLERAFQEGIIAADESGKALYGTSFKSRAEVSPEDRANREYNDGSFWFDLQGAIHKTTIRGVIRL